MKRIIAIIIGLPVFLVLAAFALANRQWITVSLDPITPADPWMAVQMPLWALLFAGIFIGLLAGGFATWLKQGKWRKKARHAVYDLDAERSRARRLERKLEETAKPVLPGPAREAS